MLLSRHPTTDTRFTYLRKQGSRVQVFSVNEENLVTRSVT